MHALSSIPLASAALAYGKSAPGNLPVSNYYFPSVLGDIDTTVSFSTSKGVAFDAPRIDVLNATTFDWWYFDVVSENLDQTISIVFHVANSSMYGLSDFNEATFVQLTPYLEGVQAEYAIPAKIARIRTVGDGSSGDFEGTGYSWAGSADLSTYTITFDDDELQAYGSIKLDSIAAPHIPCGPYTPGNSESLVVGPSVGWANSIPDAIGQVNVTINGTKFAFNGSGYHDKNWGSKPFSEAVRDWYWGHARLGNYSFVWFDFISSELEEVSSGYLYDQSTGSIVSASCGGLTVRPTGENSTWPPSDIHAIPSGYHIKYDLHGTGESILEAYIENSIQSLDRGPNGYTRWIGNITGTLDGEAVDGIALWEWLRYYQ